MNKQNHKQKKKRKIRWWLILLCSMLPFVWAIWMAFLQNIVPWKITLFFKYSTFREKVKTSYFAEELPQSADYVKYYWGNRLFVRIGGYGAGLSSDEYRQAKEDALERYQNEYNSREPLDTEIYYFYDQEQDKQWITEEYIELHDIEELYSLILDDEEINDYYVIVSYDYVGGPVNYYNCVLCNDKSCRMIEIIRTDRNPQ